MRGLNDIIGVQSLVFQFITDFQPFINVFSSDIIYKDDHPSIDLACIWMILEFLNKSGETFQQTFIAVVQTIHAECDLERGSLRPPEEVSYSGVPFGTHNVNTEAVQSIGKSGFDMFSRSQKDSGIVMNIFSQQTAVAQRFQHSCGGDPHDLIVLIRLGESPPDKMSPTHFFLFRIFISEYNA